MTSASIDSDSLLFEVDVWLDVGKEGRSFTYIDKHRLGVDLGDLVRVRLRGRPMHGLVVARRKHSLDQNNNETKNQYKTIALANVDALVQPAAVDPKWYDWLKGIADDCHIGSFRMLKTALPPGWLGQGKLENVEPKSFWWVSLETKATTNYFLTKRESS